MFVQHRHVVMIATVNGLQLRGSISIITGAIGRVQDNLRLGAMIISSHRTNCFLFQKSQRINTRRRNGGILYENFLLQGHCSTS